MLCLVHTNLRGRPSLSNVADESRDTAGEPSVPRAVGQSFGRQIDAAVDFYLHRVDRLARPAVGANDMPARIRLVARHDFAKAPRGCHYPIDQPFARAVAKTIADDDSRAVPGLPERDRRQRMEIGQDPMTQAAPPPEQNPGAPGAIGAGERLRRTSNA